MDLNERFAKDLHEAACIAMPGVFKGHYEDYSKEDKKDALVLADLMIKRGWKNENISN